MGSESMVFTFFDNEKHIVVPVLGHFYPFFVQNELNIPMNWKNIIHFKSAALSVSQKSQKP
jgi:hypothetical protein